MVFVSSLFSALLFLTVLSLCGGVSLADDHRIHSANELIKFANGVNNGMSYAGVTVLLDSDIDFGSSLSQLFRPIGSFPNNSFKGTFDGQGHAIKNLSVNASLLQFVGLFGYTEGAIIRNVVVDSSCSIEGISGGLDADHVYAGGIVGSCKTSHFPCKIKNTVNMGSMLFALNTSHPFVLGVGGIIGWSEVIVTLVSIKNCANYGDITVRANASEAYVGGIAGRLKVYFFLTTHSVKNCLNYGNIVLDTTQNDEVYVGGIIGYAMNASVMNCVSSGESSDIQAGGTVGAIVGHADNVEISGCYWNDTLFNESVSAVGSSRFLKINSTTRFSDDYTLEEAVVVDRTVCDSLLDAVNAFVGSHPKENYYSKWVLNRDRNAISFVIFTRKTPFVTLASDLIMLPNIAGGDSTDFSGWYVDEKCTMLLSYYEITKNMTLYGKIEDAPKKGHSRAYYRIIAGCSLLLFIIMVSVILVVVIKKCYGKRPVRYFVNTEPLIDEAIDEMLMSD